jgi:hypothetical protein
LLSSTLTCPTTLPSARIPNHLGVFTIRQTYLPVAIVTLGVHCAASNTWYPAARVSVTSRHRQVRVVSQIQLRRSPFDRAQQQMLHGIEGDGRILKGLAKCGRYFGERKGFARGST